MNRMKPSNIAPDKGTVVMSEDNKPEIARGAALPVSPQPEAAAPPAPEPAAADGGARPRTRAADSASKRPTVYSHMEGLQELGQLRGLRSDRRRVRFRNRTNGGSSKYAQALSILEPPHVRQKPLGLEEARKLFAASIVEFAASLESNVLRLQKMRRDLWEYDEVQQEVDERVVADARSARSEARTLRRQLQRALRIGKEAAYGAGGGGGGCGDEADSESE